MGGLLRLLMIFSLWAMVAAGLGGCGEDNSRGALALPEVLVQQTVTVARGGGGANVTFTGRKGCRIRIMLTATKSTMTPYGFVECQPGTGMYQPPQESAANGQNSAVVTLTQTGTYTLTVFDGANEGGAVSVKVERLL